MGKQYTEQEIFDKVAEYACICLTSMEGKEITPDTPVNYDGYESLNYIMMICKLEAEYDVKIPDRTWAKLKNVQEVVSTVQAAVNKKNK